MLPCMLDQSVYGAVWKHAKRMMPGVVYAGQ